jgi:D-alanyl-D-alanine dipeptidase
LAGLFVMPLVGCEQPVSPPRAGKTRTPQQHAVLPNRLVELIALDPSIHLDIRYATANNFTGRVLYPEARAFLIGAAAQALVRAHALARADGFGLTIHDAYRPWSVTKQLWDATPPAKRNFVANPKRGSRHNRGCAVDLTLHDLKTGAAVEMPSDYDEFGPRAYRDYGGGSALARANRVRLERYMDQAGFRGMSNEWWHFDFRGWEAFPILDLPFPAMTGVAKSSQNPGKG